MGLIADLISRGYMPQYAPHNNRKRTRGRNYKYVKDAHHKTRKVWLDMEEN